MLALKGSNALQLEIPPRLGKIHNIQNVEYLKPYITSNFQGRLQPIIPPEPKEYFIDGEAFEEVETILRSRYFGKRKQYLVRLKGRSVLDDHWYSAADLGRYAPDAIKDFEHEQAQRTAKEEAKRRHRSKPRRN